VGPRGFVVKAPVEFDSMGAALGRSRQAPHPYLSIFVHRDVFLFSLFSASQFLSGCPTAVLDNVAKPLSMVSSTRWFN
jgi:hypothetical protein